MSSSPQVKWHCAIFIIIQLLIDVQWTSALFNMSNCTSKFTDVEASVTFNINCTNVEQTSVGKVVDAAIKVYNNQILIEVNPI